MTIPDYQSIMLPLLKFANDEKEHRFRDAINYISNFFNLTEAKRRKKLPSGYDRIIDNRVGWARTYLKKADLLEDPKRGYFKITQRGLSIIKQNPPEINVKFLMQFEEFREFQAPKKKEFIKEFTVDAILKEKEELETPEELIERGYANLKKDLSLELFEKLMINSPEFFEKIVAKLLEKMGYGEPETFGGPGDGGVDGIIHQDKLHIDRIYFQAKRYNENSIITPNMISKFIGDLDYKGATKGVFITTSSFHRDIKRIIEGTHKSIVLIDGEKLIELMIEYGVGIAIDKTYEIKKIDSDYFEE